MALPDMLIQALADVLLHHRWPEPGKGNNCSCGQVKLGRSIPEHQARVALAVTFAALPECDEVRAALAKAFAGLVHNQDDGTWSADHALSALVKLAEA